MTVAEDAHALVEWLPLNTWVSYADIADHFGKTRQTYESLFNRAVKKIVARNNVEWEEWTGGRLNDD